MSEAVKFCSECGKEISKNAEICPHCGCRIAAAPSPNIVINNQNTNQNQNGAMVHYGRARSKWVALLLWFFFGFLGGHKFYEGKAFMGVVYIFTGGLIGIGLFFDFFGLIFKPSTYYV